MSTTRQRIWAIVFILTFALTVGMFGYAARNLDIGLMILILIPASLLLTGLCAAVTGLVAWLYRPFRRFFAPINLCLLLLLMLAWSNYFYERTKFPEEFERVKRYVAVAVPALHDYHTAHGLYPDSLSQLDLPIAVPDGLDYQHKINAGENFAASCNVGAGNDVYSINFQEAFLCPDGHWFVDD